ncbi:hypothetical protein [Clostridium beijerinckii]|uniref:Uncharacterized protein n=2 Tax=Clostridium beijerinckii TaxID=1520 RepID=A0A9Q5CJH9_CLOBE|nr:hypothetical protein [Clostridium beijerinckii]AQS05036.1 hypothetical protein CLBIJ_24660 [Clostridium beijerinckii]MBA2886025.1 hypothetical protein [Clostridium beijerinckii]MBA2900687.1 hypothetical protein [Clostridium beijerinckii]MBA2910584.1 hypothetical protein [Clostridium beijerinckii]MBA9015395.1 hypothetical protein [Clostridium beijerinckii]
MIEISESGMIFGVYEDDRVFRIEISKLHDKIGNRIKVVEFILMRKQNELDFIEAKSSSPKPIQDSEEKVEKFNKYIEEITDKFIHSFNLYYSAILGKNNHYNEISSKFLDLDNSILNFKFILVIKNHKEEWLVPILNALKRNLAYHNTIWKSDVIVVNEEIAKKYNLIKINS